MNILEEPSASVLYIKLKQKVLHNVGTYQSNYTASFSRQQQLPYTQLWQFQKSYNIKTHESVL